MIGIETKGSQRGIALVLVLWVLLLLTIITGSFALMARMDRLEAHSLLSGTQARLSAEAAINLAVLALRDPEEETRMRGDGRVYQQDYYSGRHQVFWSGSDNDGRRLAAGTYYLKLDGSGFSSLRKVVLIR